MLKDYQIKRIKEQYPKGTEIELISMEDSQAVPRVLMVLLIL